MKRRLFLKSIIGLGVAASVDLGSVCSNDEPKCTGGRGVRADHIVADEFASMWDFTAFGIIDDRRVLTASF